jgi:hypothetical protein
MLARLETMNAAHREFASILAQTPGLRGTISLDAGEGRHVSIALWDSAAAAEAAGPQKVQWHFDNAHTERTTPCYRS